MAAADVGTLRTETKATTTWPIAQLLAILPKLLHSGIRSSKYYAKRNDCISLQAQTGRSRTANTEENYQKLFEEIQALYRNSIPGETSPDKKQKYSAL
jgi:peptidyl-tRNA hydrolase ICT1